MSALRKRRRSASWIGRPFGLRPRTCMRRRLARRAPGARSAGPRAARMPVTSPFSTVWRKSGVTLTPPSRALKLAGSTVPSGPVPKRTTTLTKGCAEATLRPAGSVTRRSWLKRLRAAEAGAGNSTAQQRSRGRARCIRGPSVREETGGCNDEVRLLAGTREHGDPYVVWERVRLFVRTTKGPLAVGHAARVQVKGDHAIELAAGDVHGLRRGGEPDGRHDRVLVGHERRLLR